MCSVCNQVNQFVYIRATCAASQKMKKYKCFVAIDEDGSVASGHCECVIGYDSHLTMFHFLFRLIRHYPRNLNCIIIIIYLVFVVECDR